MNTATVSNNFPSEELETAFRYVSGYTKPKSVADQVEILHQHFPDLGSVDPAWATRRLPRFARGSLQYRVASGRAHLQRAVELVLDLLASQRHGAFFNNRAGQIDADHLRQLPETMDALRRSTLKARRRYPGVGRAIWATSSRTLRSPGTGEVCAQRIWIGRIPCRNDAC